jgi:membrane protease YdiL (CAAX protease family)
MSTRRSGLRGPAIYAAVVMVGVAIVAVMMKARHVSVGESRSQAFILLAMWMPALARFAATRTVDREWRSPFPLRRWGRPGVVIVIVPLLTVTAIYLGAYALATLAGVPRAAPAWPEGRVAINVVVNLPLLSMIGVVGALGEELGWRGYLQPRLDQLNVRYSLVWMIALETLFHLPLIVLAGYLGATNLSAAIALFFALGVGLTPLWTWATYRWRSVWMAVLFHTFHNAVSQVLVPKALGDGSPLLLGESGVFPVVAYLTAGLVVFLILRRRALTWNEFARSAIGSGYELSRPAQAGRLEGHLG